MSVSKSIFTYSRLYNNFIEHKCDEMFKVHHSSIIANMNALYIPMFQIMDIANENKLPCILKNIFVHIPNNEDINRIINENDTNIEFNNMIDELQVDVDLILTEGFLAFENKLTKLIYEINKEQNQYNELITQIHNCTDKLHKLKFDNLLATTHD
jgi:hypothetical protein